MFPQRPIVIVADNLKTQEGFQQDIETWLSFAGEPGVGGRAPAAPDSRPLFYPAWEVLPHEGRLPHADTISDRLQTLVALRQSVQTLNPNGCHQRHRPAAKNLSARPEIAQAHPHACTAVDKINPLDLIEWLEEQGYEPEAQVTQKGEIALRGGILDVWPLTSPWPVRLEFFGDELESLRHFDPLTQISREEIFRSRFRRPANWEF